ncbi:MAG: hypothetical protein KAX58_05335 [Aeromonadaceae bacterium]|nr:hypothetical protein [Aeromonadaceae bacterium]MBP8220850.1 hypothetical protein [Aeromonadaceae bacterium]
MMYEERDVVLELPIGYIREHCTSWSRLCHELGLEAEGLEQGVYLSNDRVSLDLAMAKRYGLCQEWWL